LKTVASPSVNPTTAAWGPDGRLYVGALGGTILAYTLDADYNVTASQTITALQSATNKDILGIAFNPFEPPGQPRLYVAHGQLFANGGACFTGFSPYSGQVSILTGPSFNSIQPLVTGLPVSNHDHGINGLQFDNAGDLLIAVGGNTNAGVAGDCDIGQIPESPLSAAIVKAKTSKFNFNGAISYKETAGGQPNNDQSFGDNVDVVAGVDVSVFASGVRNPYDHVFTTKGQLYATDNGPNLGFGPKSTGANTQGSEPQDVDELVRVLAGAYYGHPNRNRGRTDSRQNVYYGTSAAEIPGVFTQKITTFPSSTDGITEYRANTFLGTMRGELIAQKHNGATYRVKLSADGTSVVSNTTFPVALNSLDVIDAPGGVLVGTAYSNKKIMAAIPVDAAATGLTVYDIFPWRAPTAGGQAFEIGGAGFGTLANTTVKIGTVTATLSSVTSKRIKGTIPAATVPAGQKLDVVITVAGTAKALTAAFEYLN
jgi:glucose/arabinose dehydrogenase